MWILQFLPNWIFVALLLAGVATLLFTHFVRILPQTQLIKLTSVAVVAFSLFMTGAISNNDAWLKRVQELETKVAEAQAQSASVNIDIAEKTVVKTQVIKQRGQDTVRYIDREVIKYDTTCVIPQEFVQAHNRATEAPKK